MITVNCYGQGGHPLIILGIDPGVATIGFVFYTDILQSILGSYPCYFLIIQVS